MLKTIKKLLPVVILLVILSTGCSSASAQSDLSFRLSQLETEVANLRSQVSRLDYQRANPNLSNPQNRTPSRQPSSPLRSQDPMFDRLATLVIEIKDDIRNIQTRLSKVEARLRR